MCHLLYTGDGPHVGILASTMGSSVIRYTIDVPKNDKKYSESSRAFPAGKNNVIRVPLHKRTLGTVMVVMSLSVSSNNNN